MNCILYKYFIFFKLFSNRLCKYFTRTKYSIELYDKIRIQLIDSRKAWRNKIKIRRIISKVLAILLLFTGVISVISGIVMIATNGMDMPLFWLDGTVFTSYLIPGLILLIVISGVTISAGILLLMRKKGALEASAASGFGLLIWLFTEMYILTQMGSHFLHAIIFTEALIILIATMILLKSTPMGAKCQ